MALVAAVCIALAVFVASRSLLGRRGAITAGRLASIAATPEDEVPLSVGDRVLRPILRGLSSTSSTLLPATLARRIDERLVAAGQPVSSGAFLAILVGSPLGLGALSGVTLGQTQAAVLVPVIAAFGVLGPMVWLSGRLTRRRLQINRELPDALDLIVVSVEAGLGLEGAIARITEHADGALSEELRAQLRRTLSNERRRWAAAKARAAAADLLAKASVKRELEDLRGAAKALSSRPDLPSSLEAAASRASAVSGGAKLKSAGLHLQDPTRLGQHELGDEAIVSGAYWVDGLKEKESIDVEETVVVDTERGFASAEAKTSRRTNGGPYPYARTIKITLTRPFAVRSLVSAAGSAHLSERVEVPLAQDFELALLKEFEAASLRASCRPKDAEAAYAALETLVNEPAGIKPPYKGLLERARKAREASKRDAETLVKLEEALASSRADSAPQLCKYETKAVDGALKLAKVLPPGCDRDLPELHALRATIVRRAADQKWFLKASAEARSKRRSCDLDAARARWSEALASLDADPGARCGPAAEEEARVKTDFAELTRKIAWREELGKSLAKAESESAPARRLEILRPVTARLGALNGDCFGAESKRAASLSAAASKALTAPADGEVNRRLPADASLSVVVAEVRRERARRLEAAGASEKNFSEQAEPAAAPVPAQKAAPSTKAPLKKQPAKRPKRATKETAT